MSNSKDMSRKLTVEYDRFAEEGVKVMSVIDEDDIVVAQFQGDVAEKILELLCGDIDVEDVRFDNEENDLS